MHFVHVCSCNAQSRRNLLCSSGKLYNKVSYMFSYDMATFDEFLYDEMSIGIC